MSEYTPDRWLVVGIHLPNEILYKVFATWSGGYGGGGSWKLNSGITQARLVDEVWEFEGHSGSVYRCRKDSYGTTGHGQASLNSMIEEASAAGVKIEVMSESTDWATLAYEPLGQWLQRGEIDA